ncbi:MAG TPA: ABC transporter permease [Candidatus Acidoferrales bacterium]|jgi:putative spermidine/putrescine transport system permease protein|nr:ABC transporter permease [Candidatus Acidoferrales bacterium]
MTTSAPASPLPRNDVPPTPGRRLVAALYRRPRIQLGLLLAAPTGWFAILYLGSLAVLLVSAFWYLDPATSSIVRSFTLQNFVSLLTDPVYRTITIRTLTIAILVTLTDAVIAFPIAFYMARIAGSRARSILFMLVLLPLWSSYLVRVYAWRVILAPGGLLDWAFTSIGLPGLSPGYSDASMWLVFSYLWLPYMILPIYAGLERIPQSYLEASADLGGRGLMTFRRIVLPLVVPALAAGSIFTFSLTLGDYITPQLVGNSQFLGNVIYASQGVSNNVPFAAAFAVVPIAIMGIYLLLARRLGAFDAL